MSDDAEIVLLTLPRGDKGELRPGRQIVTFRDHELRDVIGVLEKVAAKVDTTDRPNPRSEPRRGQTPRDRAPVPQYSDAEIEADRRMF